MISRTFSYRFNVVIDRVSSVFFAASSRVVVSRVLMIARARATSSAWVFFSSSARIPDWVPGSSASAGSVEKIALIVPRTPAISSASSCRTRQG